jgi:hypothetical protein
MWGNNMNTIKKIKCPNCGSEDYECYDTTNNGNGVCWEYCCCEDCDTQFDVKYVAVEIKLD